MKKVPARSAAVDLAVDLADGIVETTDPRMNWMWGPALLGYALTELDAHLGEDRYSGFTKAYCDHWSAHNPRVDQSDTSAPALVTWAMYRRTGNPEYLRLTERVLEYIRTEPRLLGEAVNHLGHSPEGRFYPRSIWVDSLMMFAVFPARYASETGDGELLAFASRQPLLYAKYLLDPTTKLWHHAYWTRSARPYPKDLFWARGNGWVMASLPMLLDFLPAGYPGRDGIIGLFRGTSEALLPCMREDGYFETLLRRPGKSYAESSAGALIASGWFHGIRSGHLDDSFLGPAVRAFEAASSSVKRRGGRTVMTGISGPTIPLPLLPFLGYRLIPRGVNHPYGAAAFIFAAIEYDRLMRDRKRI